MTTIMKLLESGKTQREVAEQLGVPIGRLKYHLTKFRSSETAKTSHRQNGWTEDTLIDERYGADQLTALPRNPNSLYLYWELTPERIRMVEEHLNCGWNVLPKILRVYDVSFVHFTGDNFNRYWDFGIYGDSSNWIINGVAQSCSYIVDYGTTTIDGRFITILRSNIAKTPPREPQTDGEYRWVPMELLHGRSETGQSVEYIQAE
ncbi:DUF4912 domain-containing protein [Paenibacillus abyssi]|nr:DUF4912 domain-containing protein [Paenibacillus abyssi]